jgi:hypothetical protein
MFTRPNYFIDIPTLKIDTRTLAMICIKLFSISESSPNIQASFTGVSEIGNGSCVEIIKIFIMNFRKSGIHI